jgi:putative transposase
VRFKAIAQWALNYSVVDLCSALRVSPGAYYRWQRKPSKIISEDELLLYREAKRLFKQTRSGIGCVKLCRALNKLGFTIGETRTLCVSSI